LAHQLQQTDFLGGDPAAGSPTATLLRLLPPCETQVRRSPKGPRLTQTSLGWSDGRCVQGAGTYSPRDDDARLLGIPRFTRAGCSPRSQLRQDLGITSPFRGRNPLFPPLQLACGPGNSGHTDLPWPTPSSALSAAVPLVCPASFRSAAGNKRRGSRSLPDLTGHLTARTGDGHAPPLSLSGKIFNLAFNLLSSPVRFPALTPIEPQASPLVVLPRQFL